MSENSPETVAFGEVYWDTYVAGGDGPEDVEPIRFAALPPGVRRSVEAGAQAVADVAIRRRIDELDTRAGSVSPHLGCAQCGGEPAKVTVAPLASIDARCSHAYHQDLDVYRMVGHCRNCTAETLALFTVGHEASSGITGPDCPVCRCAALSWHRLAAPDEIPADFEGSDPYFRQGKKLAIALDALRDIQAGGVDPFRAARALAEIAGLDL